jgi:hypothetical protein
MKEWTEVKYGLVTLHFHVDVDISMLCWSMFQVSDEAILENVVHMSKNWLIFKWKKKPKTKKIQKTKYFLSWASFSVWKSNSLKFMVIFYGENKTKV